MRLLIVAPEFPPHAGGGLLKFYRLLADTIAQCGSTVTVLVASPFSEFDDYVTAAGVQVRFTRLADVERRARTLTHLAATPILRRYLAAAGVAADFVASHGDRFDAIETTDFGLLFAPLLSLSTRPPVTVRMHGSIGQISEHEPAAPGAELESALARLVESTFLPLADALVAYSPSNAAEWTARLGSPVAFEPPPLELPAPRATAESGFSGLVAARIQPWKGPEVLCRALLSLGADLPADMKIAWLGRDTATGEDGQSMTSVLSATYPGIWGDRVVPLGPQPAETVGEMQAGVRYTIAPSQWDTFNYTVVESMAVGSVMIASTGAGASYLIDSGRNGFTFESGDPASLATQLLAAHRQTADQRREMGDRARRTIQTGLNPESIARREIERYQSTSRRMASAPPDWTRDFVCGTTGPGSSADDFLENVSIRELARHMGRRVVRKVGLS